MSLFFGQAARRSRRDLNARRRVLESQRYQTLRSAIKKTLAAAALIVAVAALWPFVNTGAAILSLPLADGEGDGDAINLIQAPLLTGNAPGQRHYTVRARLARLSGGRSPDANLTDIDALLTMKDGAVINISAERGLFSNASQTLRLDSNVRLNLEGSYAMTTESATIDFIASDASGDEQVFFSHNGGALSAEGFSISDGGRRIQTRGRSELILHPQAGAESKAAH